MTATILVHPAKAAENVCHDEQLLIWANDLIGAMSMGEYLNDDLAYEAGIDLHELIKGEIKRIIEMAFTHPEALKDCPSSR